MSQQPHDLGYLDYNTAPNRSPSSSRPQYAASPAFNNGMSLPRQAQRPFDAPLGSSALYPSDRQAGSYNPRGMDTMGPGSGGMPAYMMDQNQQAWNYNASGVATVNGAMNGPGRQRSINRRAAIPQDWADHSGMGMPNNMQRFPGGMNGNHMGNGGLRIEHPGTHGSPGDMRSTSSDPDQLIPTAIVIKNIPFAVRKEMLAQLMLDMQLPQPYAFNYHFDNGVFRGLAFANFQSADDTRMVIEAMNGMDVQGRKLRVEYKKMLPEAERERIEREKRERRGQLEEQHRGPMLHSQSSVQSLNSLAQSQQQQQQQQRPAAPVTSMADVDLNDPVTQNYYMELVMFQRDSNREALVFPPGIQPEHRRVIHVLAHHMGLEHLSTGDAETRQLTVLKGRQPSPTSAAHSISANALDRHQRGLSRAATFDFAGDRERAASNNYAHAMGRQGPTLELPGSPDGAGIPNNLRAAKSFADLRSFTPSPSQASSSYLTPNPGMGMTSNSAARFNDYMSANPTSGLSAGNTTPGAKSENPLISGFNGLNLGSYDNNTLQAQPRNAPGAIGSQRPGANGGNAKNAPDRQPRGPEWENSAGFGGARGRSNGHMTRGSDSSDNGARIAATGTASSTRFN